MQKSELGIYIHIPFCKKKCYYCDFVSFEYNSQKIDIYVETMKKELNLYNLEKYNVTTIYIGGGTPSVISSKYIVEFLGYLKNKLKNNETKWEKIEITIELNPGTVTKDKLEDYKNIGINRISIGLQTTNNKLLKQIGRIHTFEEFISTYKLVKNTGFENCNVDLMVGLPNQTIQDIKNSLEKLLELNFQHISIYSLIIEEGTPMEDFINKGILKLPEEELERQMYWYVKNILELNGYKHYEISNFAKKGEESKHNLNCWKQKEYIGLGVSACSYLNKERYENEAELDKYIIQIQENKKIIMEQQNKEDEQKEFMLLGLRMMDGIKVSKFKEKFMDNPLFIFRNQLEKLVSQDLLVIDGDIVKLTNKGLDFANIVWEEFVDI